MDSEFDYELEYYEKYFGCTENVKRIIETCPKCGSPFSFHHKPDKSKGHIKETATCTSCDFGKRKIYTVLN